MELIEEDDRVGAEGGIALEQSSEDAFRDNFDASCGADLCVEPHAVANRLANWFPQRGSHALGRGSCCKPTWLQHEQIFPRKPGGIEQGERDSRCFPCSRRCSQEYVPFHRQRATKGWQNVFYWESNHGTFTRDKKRL